MLLPSKNASRNFGPQTTKNESGAESAENKLEIKLPPKDTEKRPSGGRGN